MIPEKWTLLFEKIPLSLTTLLTTFNHTWLGKTQTSRKKLTFYPDQWIITLTIQEAKIQVIFGCWNLSDWIEEEEYKYSIPLNSCRLFWMNIWLWWIGNTTKKERRKNLRKSKKWKKNRKFKMVLRKVMNHS